MTRLIITVDTELCVYDPAVDTPASQIWGHTVEGKDCGIGFMMDELAAHGWRCTFFLDVYESQVWGEQAIADVARAIVARGFDVQLHTHVGGRAGMAGLPVEEQRRLIREGCDRIEAWTGRRPRWHRAGHLCANRDTLRACAAEGLTGDSSFLFGWPQCASLAQRPLSPGAGRDRQPRGRAASHLAASTRSDLYSQEGILELPITTFRTLPLCRNTRHLDLDACTSGELTAIVNQAARQGLPYVVLLMHSFSLVRRTGTGYVPNIEAIEEFHRFLNAMEQAGRVDVSTVGAITPAAEGRPTMGRELHSGVLLTYHRAWKHWSRGWKNKVFALAPVVLALLGLLLFLYMMS